MLLLEAVIVPFSNKGISKSRPEPQGLKMKLKGVVAELLVLSMANFA